jgi:hypothetical protein
MLVSKRISIAVKKNPPIISNHKKQTFNDFIVTLFFVLSFQEYPLLQLFFQTAEIP